MTFSEDVFRIRPARFSLDQGLDHPENADITHIWELLTFYAKSRLLLPRTKEDIFEKIRNFRIAEINGKVIGCAALRDYGNGLFEIRSLAIAEEYIGQRIGSRIVEELIRQKRESGKAVQLFALTYRDEFFKRLGFRTVDKSLFPGKIWSDCAVCSKKDCCDEIAVLLELNSDAESVTTE